MSEHPSPAPPDLPGSLRLAVVVLMLEVLALLVGAVVVLEKLVTGSPHSVLGSVLLAALALGGATLLFAGARGIGRGHGGWRSPVVVIQLLAIPVAYSLAFQAGRVGYGGPILVAALVTLFLLFVPPSREMLDRRIGE